MDESYKKFSLLFLFIVNEWVLFMKHTTITTTTIATKKHKIADHRWYDLLWQVALALLSLWTQIFSPFPKKKKKIKKLNKICLSLMLFYFFFLNLPFYTKYVRQVRRYFNTKFSTLAQRSIFCQSSPAQNVTHQRACYKVYINV